MRNSKNKEISNFSESDCPCCGASWDGEFEYIQTHKLLKCSYCGMLHVDFDTFQRPDYTQVYHTEEYKESIVNNLRETKNWSQFKDIATYTSFFDNIHISHDKQTLLDIGCGVGRFCRAAYLEGWKVTGIDVSKTAIEIGSENVPFDLKCVTLEDYLLENKVAFDVITSFEVLEHLESPLDFTKSIYSILNTGGRFFCTVPNLDSPSVRHTTRKDWLPPIHILFFTAKSLEMLLLRAGFHSVKTGVILINEPSSKGFKSVRRSIKKAFGFAKEPNPLGIWGCAIK